MFPFRNNLKLDSTWKSKKRVLTLEIPSLGFFPIFSKLARIIQKKLGHPRGFNLWSFDSRIIVGDRPYPKLWEKYNKKLSKILI